MALRDVLFESSSDIYIQNMELLEDYQLITPMGSVKKSFLKFLASKDLNLNKNLLSEDVIDEYERLNGEYSRRFQKQITSIFNERKVWITIEDGGEWRGCDLYLDSEGIIIENPYQKILYSDIDEINISEGGWSKNRFSITCAGDDFVFEINEDNAYPLKEILEENIENSHYDESDELFEIYELYEKGLLSQEEFEVRKEAIYNDVVYCTNCGFKLERGSKFCSECGHPV